MRKETEIRIRSPPFKERKLQELSQNADTGKWAQLYWIDHTENYYRTLQLATKYDGKEYILHDFSDYVEGAAYITFQVDSYPAQGNDSGHVSFYIDNISTPYFKNTVRLTFNEIPNDNAVRAYLRNTIMPQLGLKYVHLKGHGISAGTYFDEIVSIE